MPPPPKANRVKWETCKKKPLCPPSNVSYLASFGLESIHGFFRHYLCKMERIVVHFIAKCILLVNHHRSADKIVHVRKKYQRGKL